MMRRVHLTPSISSVVVLSVAIVLLLSGYGGAAQAASRSTRDVSGPLVAGAPLIKGVAGLRAQPNGEANLTWDPANANTLTVTLSPTGLAPNTPDAYHSDPYPATLGSGSCQQPGKELYPLQSVTADKYGAGSSTTTIKNVTGGIPAKDWYITLSAPGAAG